MSKIKSSKTDWKLNNTVLSETEQNTVRHVHKNVTMQAAHMANIYWRHKKTSEEICLIQPEMRQTTKTESPFFAIPL